MKVQGISGKRSGHSFGSINDVDIAINKWLGENPDAAIVDIKIISRDNHYDALILYETYISKHGKSTGVDRNGNTVNIENSVSVDRRYINDKLIPEVVAVLKDLSLKNVVELFGPDLDGLAEFIKGKI